MKFENQLLSDDDSLEINITPLIDVVFLLLIFFMVSTSFVETRGIKVKLPGSKSGAVERSAKPAELTLTEDGTLLLGGEPLPLSKLTGILRTHLDSGGESTLILKADTLTEHGQVVQVMDIAKTSGIEKIAIATVPQKNEGK